MFWNIPGPTKRPRLLSFFNFPTSTKLNQSSSCVPVVVSRRTRQGRLDGIVERPKVIIQDSPDSKDGLVFHADANQADSNLASLLDDDLPSTRQRRAQLHSASAQEYRAVPTASKPLPNIQQEGNLTEPSSDIQQGGECSALHLSLLSSLCRLLCPTKTFGSSNTDGQWEIIFASIHTHYYALVHLPMCVRVRVRMCVCRISTSKSLHPSPPATTLPSSQKPSYLFVKHGCGCKEMPTRNGPH